MTDNECFLKGIPWVHYDSKSHTWSEGVECNESCQMKCHNCFKKVCMNHQIHKTDEKTRYKICHKCVAHNEVIWTGGPPHDWCRDNGIAISTRKYVPTRTVIKLEAIYNDSLTKKTFLEEHSTKNS